MTKYQAISLDIHHQYSPKKQTKKREITYD